MNRILAYSDRNRKELLRDPLSYVFCLAFPLVMLVVMTLVDTSIPRESGMTVFHIQRALRCSASCSSCCSPR